MTRIKYKKHPDRNIYFTKQFLAGKKLVNATIINRDTDNRFQVIVHDLNDGIIIYEQLCVSFASAKRVVKNKFKEVGVEIADEVRKKLA